jgi:SAM-dependent methyltransferase
MRSTAQQDSLARGGDGHTSAGLRPRLVTAEDDLCADLVFSVNVIHHVAARLAHFAEALRVLRPSARLCTDTEDEAMICARRLSR